MKNLERDPSHTLGMILDKFQSDFGLTPVVACEIEFYLHGSDKQGLGAFWQAVRGHCTQQGIGIFKIEKERGREQHEVALVPENAIKAGQDCIQLIQLINEVAYAYGMRADFSAKPFADQPGSGLHVHVHLADENGRNVFYKDDLRISDALKFSIGGLLAKMQSDMPVFAPFSESYKRFEHPGDHTPTTVSWGANNRTVALRLPDARPEHKHIEHRVAGADAAPEAVIFSILTAMHWGMSNNIEPSVQIYGDAKLPMYKLPLLVSL